MRRRPRYKANEARQPTDDPPDQPTRATAGDSQRSPSDRQPSIAKTTTTLIVVVVYRRRRRHRRFLAAATERRRPSACKRNERYCETNESNTRRRPRLRRRSTERSLAFCRRRLPCCRCRRCRRRHRPTDQPTDDHDDVDDDGSGAATASDGVAIVIVARRSERQ